MIIFLIILRRKEKLYGFDCNKLYKFITIEFDNNPLKKTKILC